MKLIYILVTALTLTACQGSSSWYGESSQEKIVTVNSFKWTVTPQEKKNHYAVSTRSLTISSDVEQRKQDQIEAVEMATGCTVKKSKYAPNSFILQTSVRCKN